MDLLLRLFPNPLLLIVLFCLLQLLLIYPAVSLSDSLEAVFPQQEGDSTPKQRDFCLGTANGRTAINVNSLNHYARLKMSFIYCSRIVGNLEITHVTRRDIRDELNRTQRTEEFDLIKKNPFYFLEDIEEITGYLLIYNVQVEEIAFSKLKVIWGEQMHEGNALQVDRNYGLRILSLPSLRTIEQGNLTIVNSPDLCYMDPSRNYVDYSEILGAEFIHSRLNVNPTSFNASCRQKTKGCHRDCNNACFGPLPKQCQTIYRRMCISCESRSCYFDDQGTARCCDGACAGGCTGDGREKCTACKRYEQDGKCVNECAGIHTYHQNTMVKEELLDDEKRYYYGRHCVRKCPPGTLIEDKYCVTRCSENHYRDADKDDQRCVPCNGPCPKVCELNEPINSMNVQELVSCFEIDGNIVILNHVFDEHIPDIPVMGTHINQTLELKMVPPLTAVDLNVLKTVKIVTGFVAIEGGRAHSHKRPTSLNFLDGLEMIEGRRLYHERFALYVIGNYELKWLGLRSLKKVKRGTVLIKGNRNLCYSQSIPFDRLLGVNGSSWRENKNTEECEVSNRKCDSTCDPELGCWGPGPRFCVQCKNFVLDGSCADVCPKDGYFFRKDNPRQCFRCHDQCLECVGPEPTDCSRCRNYEYKIITSDGTPALECLATCPNSTFPNHNQTLCLPCSKACYEFGCTGPKNWLGDNGCNGCRVSVEDEHSGRIKCLVGEIEDDVCGPSNNLGNNYYLSLHKMNRNKYICRKCRPECRTCRRDSFLVNDCDCANYRLVINESHSSFDICTNECGRGSYILKSKNSSDGMKQPGLCRRCHPLCDDHFSCHGPSKFDCQSCSLAGINETGLECLPVCPPELPFPYEGLCHAEDKEMEFKRRRNLIVLIVLMTLLLFIVITMYLGYRCTTYKNQYIREAQMHLPEIPPLDPRKVTQRPNMRRLVLIEHDDLDYSKGIVLGSGAFGIVYAGRYKPPGKTGIKIAVAIKAINPSETRYRTDEKEMLQEAGLMAQIQHEHLLPFVGISLKGGLKIVTLLRIIGPLNRFLEQQKRALSSKNLILYCYQIASAMEYLTRRKIVHRDLAARNVLVKNFTHVEVTDFGLAEMLHGAENTVVREGRVAVKWMALESLRSHFYNEKTDVWSFGITCWEIITLGQVPYRDLSLHMDQRLPREMFSHLEKGGRLKQPQNCAFNFYQEIVKCWLEDANSRPNFKELKSLFEDFCTAPHLCILDRQASQRMAPFSSFDQRTMIENLLKESDFLDPTNLDPCEYMPITPKTAITDLSSSSNGGGDANGGSSPNNSPTPFQKPNGEATNGTAERRRVLRSLAREPKLIPIDSVNEETNELVFGEEVAAGYTPVIETNATSTIADEEDQEEDPYIPTYLNELDPQQDGASYVNDHSSSPTHNDNNNKKKTNKRLPQFHKQGHKQHSADVNGVDGERDLITLSPSSSLTSTAVEQKRELNNNLCEYKDGIAQNNASNFSVETCETSF